MYTEISRIKSILICFMAAHLTDAVNQKTLRPDAAGLTDFTPVPSHMLFAALYMRRKRLM